MSTKPCINPDHTLAQDAIIRRARKAHPCHVHRLPPDRSRVVSGLSHEPLPEGHTTTIAPGDHYVEDRGDLTHPYHAGRRYCLACAEADGLITPPTA
ncbi:MAG: hypothetical protein ACOC9T_00100 [Myxococcota bacterium]